VNSQWGLSFCAALRREIKEKKKDFYSLYFFIVRKKGKGMEFVNAQLNHFLMVFVEHYM